LEIFQYRQLQLSHQWARLVITYDRRLRVKFRDHHDGAYLDLVTDSRIAVQSYLQLGTVLEDYDSVNAFCRCCIVYVMIQ
jgi:hypothetical protein